MEVKRDFSVRVLPDQTHQHEGADGAEDGEEEGDAAHARIIGSGRRMSTLIPLGMQEVEALGHTLTQQFQVATLVEMHQVVAS